ncbi:MAG: helix-turn-helix domain-containing protein [Actinomycetia bacterium]|nr:helix-turn-helix domain-containing protein [Actinomycetes bacterium]
MSAKVRERHVRAVDAKRPLRPATERTLAEPRFLTVAEVAAVMRVSNMTVYRLVHGGELEAIRVGRSFRVPESAVHEYLQAAFVKAG